MNRTIVSAGRTLVALLMIYLMGTVPALALVNVQVDPPHNLRIKPPQCILGQNCHPGIYFQLMTTQQTGYTEQQVRGQQLVKAQLLAAVTAINSAETEMITNGTAAVWTAMIKANAKLLTAPTMNIAQLYPILVAHGYTGSESFIVQWYAKYTQAQRTATVNYIVAHGFQGFMAQLSALTYALAAHLGQDEKFHKPSLLECQYVEDIEYAAMFVAAGAALIGAEPAAAGLGFIGASAALGGYLWGC